MYARAVNVFVRVLVVLSILGLLSACVSLNVNKVSALKGDEEICVQNNSSVRNDFLLAYQRRINEHGYKTRVVAGRDDPSCEFITTYTAKYGFHWGVYLSFAELNIYKKRELVGSAIYKAPFMSMGKHGRGEGKIQKMVEELLPSPLMIN